MGSSCRRDAAIQKVRMLTRLQGIGRQSRCYYPNTCTQTHTVAQAVMLWNTTFPGSPACLGLALQTIGLFDSEKFSSHSSKGQEHYLHLHLCWLPPPSPQPLLLSLKFLTGGEREHMTSYYLHQVCAFEFISCFCLHLAFKVVQTFMQQVYKFCICQLVGQPCY